MAYDMAVVRTAYNTAVSMGASNRVLLALFEAGIVESGFRNLNYGDRDSLGFLQQRPSQGWPNPTDVPTATRSFVSKAMPIQNLYPTAGQLAQAVQRSAFPLKYDAVAPQASALLAQVRAENPESGTTPTGTTLLGVGDSLSNVNKALDFLSDKTTYIRASMLIGGFMFLGFAVYKLVGVSPVDIVKARL